MEALTPYIGRFAPSPTGALHFGSLVAALGSWLEARRRGGVWAVRIDDLDRPRCPPGVGDTILKTLDAFGLAWDGPVIRQSRRDAAYAAALETLIERGRVFPCACTRKEVQHQGAPGPAGVIYPGTCRDGLPEGRRARSWRFRVDQRPIRVNDRLRRAFEVHLDRDIGDFIVRRGDGLFAYHLAMVVDDADLGVTEVVRGGDLLDCTAPQIALQQALGCPTPEYLHLPVAVDARGRKLSKQTAAPALDPDHPGPALVSALRFLGQPPPTDLSGASAAAILAWAQAHWKPERIPGAATLPAP